MRRIALRAVIALLAFALIGHQEWGGIIVLSALVLYRLWELAATDTVRRFANRFINPS